MKLLVLGIAAALLVGCAATGSSAGRAAGSSAGRAAAIPGCPTSQPPALGAGERRTVTITTDLGTIVIAVSADLSPIATGNFVALASCGFYDGVVFQRVVPGFVIQGGDGEFGRSPDIDPARVGSGGPGYEIADEPVSATYARGVVAMARSRQPNSQGSQFFIILDDSAADLAGTGQHLRDPRHGDAAGMDVADKIAAAADRELPSQPVVMTDVSVKP
ncbi:MAG: peptidylprolyl isomerase [Candidatus Limnocylindrales bacterium]